VVLLCSALVPSWSLPILLEKPVPTQKKADAVASLQKRIEASSSLFLTSYSALTVSETTRLRKSLRHEGASYAVVKNTLFARALGDELAERLSPYLTGSTSVTFGQLEPVALAKTLRDFADETKLLKIKAAYIDGQVVDAAQVEVLAALPPKTELLARLVGSLASPMRGLLTVLSGNQSGLVRVLDAIRQQRTEA